MLPETIDDLLIFAGSDLGPMTWSMPPAQMPPAGAPCLVLLAHGDGSVILADEFGSEAGQEVVAGLARDLVGPLSGEESCALEINTPTGPRLALALRLPGSGPGAFVACLVDPLAIGGAPLDHAGTSALVCSAMAWAALRHKAKESELLARTEQLMAGQDALHASYSRNLAEAIEEHEERLRERKAAEEKLKRLHACNKLILDFAGEGIVGLDGCGKVVFVNPVVQRLVGWDSDDMIGKVWHELVQHTRTNGQEYDWEESSVLRALRGDVTQRVSHEVFWRKDGTSFPVEYVTTPMLDEGEIVGAVMTFQDISERRVLEGQLVQAQKLESIGQLAAGIAHEINTPTQFVGDNLRFLEDAFSDLKPLLAANRRLPAAIDDIVAATGLLPEVLAATQKADLEYLIEEIPKAISQSLEGLERVAKIVRSMKEFSHPGGNEMQPIDLNKALESTLTVCRNEWKYVADAVTDFDESLPLVSCLPGACNQVFLNLIINAAHAIADKQGDKAADKGTITISTRADGDWVEIRITDTGTGIAEEHRTRVFDPFFTTKEVGRGTGQGLAIARSVLVDKHGGTLSFESEVGRGTTFVVRLPCRTMTSCVKGATDE